MPRPTFWQRFLRLNAPLVAGFLRQVADEVELLLPGQPELAFLFFDTGGLMQNPTVPDTTGPFTARAAFLDAEGNPTTPAADETPSWSSDNEAVATVAATDGDPTSATVTLTGQLGAAVISVSSTNESGQNVSAQGTVTVVASDETTATIDFDVASPTPPPPTP